MHVQLLVGRQAVLHIVNVYLPPNLPNYTSAWLEVMALLDRLPASDPLLLLGDFNAHIALAIGGYLPPTWVRRTGLIYSQLPPMASSSWPAYRTANLQS